MGLLALALFFMVDVSQKKDIGTTSRAYKEQKRQVRLQRRQRRQARRQHRRGLDTASHSSSSSTCPSPSPSMSSRSSTCQGCRSTSSPRRHDNNSAHSEKIADPPTYLESTAGTGASTSTSPQQTGKKQDILLFPLTMADLDSRRRSYETVSPSHTVSTLDRASYWDESEEE